MHVGAERVIPQHDIARLQLPVLSAATDASCVLSGESMQSTNKPLARSIISISARLENPGPDGTPPERHNDREAPACRASNHSCRR